MRSVQVLRRLTARSGVLRSIAQANIRSTPIKSLNALSNVTFNPNLAIQQVRSFASTGYSDDDEEYFEEEEDNYIQYPPSSANIGQVAPNFTASAVVDGDIQQVSLKDYRGKYVVLFFYPKDFTYVCPTEIIAFNDRASEFAKLNTQLIAASTDSPESHLAWTKLSRSKGGLGSMEIPLVADITKMIAAKYGVLSESDGIAFRGLFIIDKEGVLHQKSINNFPIGRSVDETLRLLQAIQFHEEHGEVCPANWQPGDQTIIADHKNSHKYFSTVKDDVDGDDNSTIQTITSKSEFDAILKSNDSVVAKFYAPWCGKCAQILPFVEELAAANPNVTFVKLNSVAPEIEALKDEMEVGAFPEFRFFKAGKEIGTPVSGYKKRFLKDAVQNLF